MKSVQISVFGIVQGVNFRAASKAVADQLRIKGTVVNMPDGSVRIHAIGDDFEISELINFCNSGPERAKVERVDVIDMELPEAKNFIILKRLT